MTDIIIIQTSVDSQKTGEKLAEHIIKAGLAACVQITGPGTSVYRWKGELHHEHEWYLSMKTSQSCATRLIDWLEQHHPYDLPEIIHQKVPASRSYALWVEQTCRVR